MRFAPALLAPSLLVLPLLVLSLLSGCSGEKDPQVAKVTPDEKQALDEAGAMLGAPAPGAAATPGATPPH